MNGEYTEDMSPESFKSPQPKRPEAAEAVPLEGQYLKGEIIGKGGNSTAYEVTGQPDKVLLAIGNVWGGETAADSLQKSLERVQQKIQKYATLPEHTNAPKILQAWAEQGVLSQVMERAQGQPIHARNGSFEQWQHELEVLANAPDEHYQKFLTDLKALEETGFVVDPSKPDNFYYDPATGFHFIDLELRTETTPPVGTSSRMIVPFIHTYNLFTKYSDQLSPEVKHAIQKIIDTSIRTGIVDPNGAPDDVRRLQEIQNTIKAGSTSPEPAPTQAQDTTDIF